MELRKPVEIVKYKVIIVTGFRTCVKIDYSYREVNFYSLQRTHTQYTQDKMIELAVKMVKAILDIVDHRRDVYAI